MNLYMTNKLPYRPPKLREENKLESYLCNKNKSLCILIVVYVVLLLSTYSYCCLRILIVRPCILKVVYVFLLLSMYSYCCPCILIVRPCILIVVYVFSLLSMYTYCCLCILRRGYPDRFFRAFSSVVRQMPGYK